MQNPPSFSYSLCQVEEGWRWCVYDEDGATVACGADVSRERAQAAVEQTLRSRTRVFEVAVRPAPELPRDEPRPLRSPGRAVVGNLAISYTYRF
jgi:hypothetical protein